MTHAPDAPDPMAVAATRRRWLLGGALALTAMVARAQSGAASAPPASPAPRLRFRSHRAVCDCSGELDDDAIEQAEAAREGRAASAPTGRATDKSNKTTAPKPTTTRRPAS